MKWIRTALTACVVALAASAAWAQSGGMTIKVVDTAGGSLPGANVTISNSQGFIKETTIQTNLDGLAEFPVLRPGSGYAITVTFPGLQQVRLDDLRVGINQTTTQSVQLAEEQIERVQVVATSDVVDLETTQTTTRFSDNFIQDLPVPGRYYQNVLTLAPGVQDANNDGNPNVHGSRSRDFKAIVSGVSNVDPFTGQTMSNVNPDSIEEIEVITAGAGVTYSGAQGGYARIIQKQGNNEHEGLFTFIYRSSKLDGNGPRAAHETALPIHGYDSYTPSVQFSGPIMKDKLWYRLSHEIRHIEDPRNVAQGTAVVTAEEATHSDQITWQVSPRNKLAFLFQSDPRKVDNFGVSTLTPTTAASNREYTGRSYSVEWTAPQSPKVLVVSQLSWVDTTQKIEPTAVGIENACIDGSPFQETALCFDQEAGFSGGYPINWDDHRQRFAAHSHATWYGGRFWGMSHQFEFGLDIDNQRYARTRTDRPVITRFRVDPTLEGGSGEADPYYQLNMSLSVPAKSFANPTGTTWNFFAQDQMKPAPNLTITVGGSMLREEINSKGSLPFDPQAEFAAFREAAPLDASSNTYGLALVNNFTAPQRVADFFNQVAALACAGVADPIACSEALRTQSTSAIESAFKTRRAGDIHIANTNPSGFLSVSWDPWSTGKNAFKATIGRQYNALPLLVPAVELDSATTDVAYRTGTTSLVPSSSNGIRPDVNVLTVDRDLRTPYADEWTVSFERELWTETRLTVQYINKKYRDQIQDKNLNLVAGDFGRCVFMTGRNQVPVTVSPGACPEGVADADCPSEFRLHDFWTGEDFVDRDPSNGDGRLDDCIGRDEVIEPPPTGGTDPGADRNFRLFRPDGRADLYIQNPFWGDIFLVGNFNFSDYEAYQLELVRRQYRSWEFQGSYVFSRSKGNGEDFLQEYGDDPSLIEGEFGYQSQDQRHVVKLNATTVTPWGIRLGGAVAWQSGLPFSIQESKFAFDASPPELRGAGDVSARPRIIYPTGVRNDQRNESYWDVSMKATKEMNLGRGVNLQVSAEIYNLLNDDTYLVYNEDTEIGIQRNGINDFYRRDPRQFQLGMRLSF